MIFKSIFKGMLGAAALLAVYGTVVGLLSGRNFLLEQLALYWYFIVALALGFGVQVGLYAYLRSMVRESGGKGIVAVTGTTSTAAMLSCCAHYLVNILPMLGATGALTVLAQYQLQFFWVGIALNLVGIAYIGCRAYAFSK